MFYFSEEEFLSEMKKVEQDNLSKERKRKLKEEKLKYKNKFKFPSTSKMVLWGAIILCLQIVVFCEYIMITTGDTSALYVLIGIPATLVPVIWGYYSKSKAENTKDGIVYDLAMKELENKTQENSENSDEAVG